MELERGSKWLTLGVSPLKKAEGPSCLMRSFTTVKPETLRSKLAFCIRVLTVSRGAATVIDATAPAIEAMKFWPQVALEKSDTPSAYSLVTADAPKSCMKMSSRIINGLQEAHRETSGSIAGHCPAPTTVKRGALFHEDTHNAAAAERLRVHLALNFERVKRKQNLQEP